MNSIVFIVEQCSEPRRISPEPFTAVVECFNLFKESVRQPEFPRTGEKWIADLFAEAELIPSSGEFLLFPEWIPSWISENILVPEFGFKVFDATRDTCQIADSQTRASTDSLDFLVIGQRIKQLDDQFRDQLVLSRSIKIRLERLDIPFLVRYSNGMTEREQELTDTGPSVVTPQLSDERRDGCGRDGRREGCGAHRLFRSGVVFADGGY